MTIHFQYIMPAVIAIIMWLSLYCFSVIMRFGSDLTVNSELIVFSITAIPVVIGVLYWFNVIKFMW